ncbi:MAG: exonuclease domain-containing protein [Gemmatimonas sp.]
MSSNAPLHSPPATRILSQPTTLSARAAARLANGPLDATTLMRDVCQVARLQADAADRMAVALLSSHAEFLRLPSGHWAIRDEHGAPVVRRPAAPVHYDPATTAAHARVMERPSPFDAIPDVSPELHEVGFAVVDVETTGTRASGSDRVTEIAIATVRRGTVSDVYTTLVNPERLIPARITDITGITWAMVKDQPCFRHIAAEVTTRLAGHVFTAHNASFDWRFVSEELRRGSNQTLAGPKLCTVRLARVLLPNLARRSLDHLTHYFGIEINARHRAAGDAEATAKALLRMLKVAEDLGVTSWSALETMAMRPASRRRVTASDRRRRAFPHSAIEDHIA